MKQKSLNGLAWNVMWRIIIVIAYYILLILLSILILVSVYFFSIYLFFPLVLYLSSVYIIILAIVAWVGLCCLALMFAAFLIKPLFSSTDSTEDDNTLEVDREDCPELFDVITDVVRQTGTKMPKHVYLSPDDNACVFFDSSFWSIFFPIRKNLKIGLGLFNGMSIEELKSILAHEFGHFSQGSMKIGSSVYVINQVLYNMTYKRDGWDDLLESWSTTDSNSWIANVFAFWGLLTIRLTSWVKRGNLMMYRYVHQAYMALSRQMEYDADNISCKCVGKDCFISGMYKTEINSRNLRFFSNIMKDLIVDKKKVKNIYEAIEITNNTYYKDDPTLIEYDHPIVEPLLMESKIRVNDVWASHPINADRIENAKKNQLKEAVKPTPAWNLITKEIEIRVSSIFFWTYDDYMKCQEISNEDYTSWLDQYLPQHYMPNQLTPFLGRYIAPFDLTHPQVGNVEYPFTYQNRMVIDDYQVTLNDWDLIQKIQNHEIDTKNLYINGEILTASDFPIDEYKKHLSELKPFISDLDRQVYCYLASHCQEESKTILESAYNLLFYAENTIDGCLSSLMNLSIQTKDKLVGIFNAYGGFNKDAVYDLIEKYVINFNKHLQGIDPEAISFVTEKGYLINVRGELTAYTEVENLSKTDYLNRILMSLPQELIDVHKYLIVRAQKAIADIAQDAIKNKEYEDGDDRQRVFVCNITPVTIDKIDDSTSSGTIGWIFASAFALSIVILYMLMYPKENKISLESEKDEYGYNISSDNSEFICSEIDDPIIEKMKDAKGLKILPICVDTINNIWIRAYIPIDLCSKKVHFSEDDNLNGFEIYEDVLFPPYNIYLLGKHFLGSFGDDEINIILKDCDKILKLENVHRTSESRTRYFNQSTICYIITQKYDTEPQKLVDVYVIHPMSDNNLCCLFYIREKELDSPFEKILRSIRFKRTNIGYRDMNE